MLQEKEVFSFVSLTLFFLRKWEGGRGALKGRKGEENKDTVHEGAQ